MIEPLNRYGSVIYSRVCHQACFYTWIHLKKSFQQRTRQCYWNLYVFTHDIRHKLYTWWRHQMETFPAVLALCARNSPVTGEFSSQRPVRWGFDISLDLRLNKRLSKQSWGWWLKTTSHSSSSSCLNNSRKLFRNNHSLTFCGMVFHAYTMLFRPICTSYFHVPNCVLILQSTIAIFFYNRSLAIPSMT